MDLRLSDLPSDEEEVINSSDEDNVSSASSKGEPDLLEDKQVCCWYLNISTFVFLGLSGHSEVIFINMIGIKSLLSFLV